MSKTHAHQLIMPVAWITRGNNKWEQDCLRALSCWFSCKLGCIWALFKTNNLCSKTESAQRATNESWNYQQKQEKQNWSIAVVVNFQRKTFLQATYSFQSVLPQRKEFNLGTDTIDRTNILWKIKILFFLYPRAGLYIYKLIYWHFQGSFQS